MDNFLLPTSGVCRDPSSLAETTLPRYGVHDKHRHLSNVSLMSSFKPRYIVALAFPVHPGGVDSSESGEYDLDRSLRSHLIQQSLRHSESALSAISSDYLVECPHIYWAILVYPNQVVGKHQDSLDSYLSVLAYTNLNGLGSHGEPLKTLTTGAFKESVPPWACFSLALNTFD
ncbi:hypothetical protein J6590_048207 [Homalodisca vitripennis]|nr:hypothetical protein J6590_048207 [Homalodisca vitripennis]